MTIHKKDSKNLAHSRLNETHTDIVLDASVLINILATGRAATILANLDRKILITSQAYNEVLRDPFTAGEASETIKPMEAANLISRRNLSGRSKQLYEILSNPAEHNLDSGEAATIGFCDQHKLIAAIDERKGTKVAIQNSNVPLTVRSLDLLAYKNVIESFTIAEYRQALQNAGRLGRMYFPIEWGHWAENILEETVARTLPGLKKFYRIRDMQ